jgi:hypothetical protein
MALGIKTGGRAAGTPNKRTQYLQQRLEVLGVDPVMGLAAIANDESAPLELRASVQMDLMTYLYPKRKALDLESASQTPINFRIGLTAQPTTDIESSDG